MRIEYLEKKGGARLKDVATFKVACEEKDIVAYKSLKTGEEARVENFGHVFVGKVGEHQKDFVVKVYSVDSPYLGIELEAYKRLKGTPFECYTPKAICHFDCMDNMKRWMRRVKPKTPVCMPQGQDRLHFIVVEYIKHAEFDRFMSSASIEAIRAMAVQTVLMIADLMLNYGIMHSDIHSGNILIRQTSVKENTFNIDGKTYRVKTWGYMPMLVDFGLCNMGLHEPHPQLVIAEMSTAIHLVHLYMNKDYLVQRKALSVFLLKSHTRAGGLNGTIREYVESVRLALKG